MGVEREEERGLSSRTDIERLRLRTHCHLRKATTDTHTHTHRQSTHTQPSQTCAKTYACESLYSTQSFALASPSPPLAHNSSINFHVLGPQLLPPSPPLSLPHPLLLALTLPLVLGLCSGSHTGLGSRAWTREPCAGASYCRNVAFLKGHSGTKAGEKGLYKIMRINLRYLFACITINICELREFFKWKIFTALSCRLTKYEGRIIL